MYGACGVPTQVQVPRLDGCISDGLIFSVIRSTSASLSLSKSRAYVYCHAEPTSEPLCLTCNCVCENQFLPWKFDLPRPDMGPVMDLKASRWLRNKEDLLSTSMPKYFTQFAMLTLCKTRCTCVSAYTMNFFSSGDKSKSIQGVRPVGQCEECGGNDYLSVSSSCASWIPLKDVAGRVLMTPKPTVGVVPLNHGKPSQILRGTWTNLNEDASMMIIMLRPLPSGSVWEPPWTPS